MHPLKILFGFFGRFLPSFTRIGYSFRRLFWQPLRLDAQDQTWLITGASGGLGAAMTHAAAHAGARVLAVARSRDKLEAMRAAAGATQGEIIPLVADCSSVAAMTSLAASLEETVDVLINNVGVMLHERALTEEQVEVSFATNVLAPYAMTNALVAQDRLAKNAAVISMSSGGMYNVPLATAALESSASSHQGATVYALHKRAQLALTEHWQARATDGRRFYVMHPGWVDTPGVQTAMPVFRKILRFFLRDAEQGVDTALWLAATRPPVANHSLYFDRKARTDHIFAQTRLGADKSTFIAFLDERLARLASLSG